MTIWVRAGLLGAAFSGAPSTAITLARRGDVLASTEAVGAAVLPRQGGRTARLLAGGAAHVLISLLWAAVLARLLRGPLSRQGATRLDGAAMGALCGLGIAALDLGIVGRRIPPIRSLASGPQIADHVAYGALVGWNLKAP